MISSRELQRTGSVRSSSAPSIHPLKDEAFLANWRYSSSTLHYTRVMCCHMTQRVYLVALFQRPLEASLVSL